MPSSAFPLFGPLHCGLLLATLLTPCGLAMLARFRPSTLHPIRWSLAFLLAGNAVWSIWLGWEWRGGFSPDALPMHLCDWALVAVVIALLMQKPAVFEVAYFWGLAGTIQGIITPDLRADHPTLRYVTFFITHCGIVWAVLFLTWGMKFRTTQWAVLRALGWTQVYVVTAALVNLCTGANFGYLRAKPVGPSMLELLPAWPWYLLILEGIALILFSLLNLPFALTKATTPARPELTDPCQPKS